MVTEFLIEAQSGGTCLLRVVSSAFGTGADWENEFFDDMARYWAPMFENLRLYLTHFPGQRVTSMYVEADVPGAADAVWSAMRRELGVGEVGAPIEARGLSGQIERIGVSPAPNQLLMRLAHPVPGLMYFMAWDKGDGRTNASVAGYLFSQDAPSFVERETPAWKAWLEDLAIPAA